MNYELVKVATEHDWEEYHALRRRVLWGARGRSDYDPTRPAERAATNHPLLLKLDGRPIGTTRLDDLGDGRGVVRLVAIASDVQRQGHGRSLSGLVERYAQQLGLHTLLVNADPAQLATTKKSAGETALGMKRSLLASHRAAHKWLSRCCVILEYR
jgi:N-acetylglutamate synthase-like GNAT family acetyltransferase